MSDSTVPDTVTQPTEETTDVKIEKHDLEHHWTFSYTLPLNMSKERKDQINHAKGETWDANTQDVTTVTTAEDLLLLLEAMKPPSEVAAGSDYNFFKKGIKPMYEDEKNAGGVELRVEFKKDKGRDSANQPFENLMLAFAGEQMSGVMRYVNGIRMSARKEGCRLAIWTQPVTEELKQQIKDQFFQRMGVADKNAFSYRESKLVDDKKPGAHGAKDDKPKSAGGFRGRQGRW